MKHSYLDELISILSIRHGLPAKRIRADMEALIDACWNDPDPLVHEKWAAISKDGKRPTLEELLLYAAVTAQDLRNTNP